MLTGQLSEQDQIIVNQYIEIINNTVENYITNRDKEFTSPIPSNALAIYSLLEKLLLNDHSDQAIQTVFSHLENNNEALILLSSADSFGKSPRGFGTSLVALLKKACDQQKDIVIQCLLNLDKKRPEYNKYFNTTFILSLIDTRSFKYDKNQFFKLISLGTDCNQQNILGISPGVIMLEQGNVELFEEYITHFSDRIDFQILTYENKTLLHYATQKPLYRKQDIDFISLMMADKPIPALVRDTSVISQLLEKGLRADQTDIYGFTPLDYALFSKNLEAAQILSGKTAEELRQDVRFGLEYPQIDHINLVEQILRYITLKQQTQNFDPELQFKKPNINNGVCHGWSFLAAFSASRSPEEINQFYNMIDLFCKWDGSARSLQNIPEEFRSTFSSLDEMFRYLTNELYWFHQQGDVNIGMSRGNRVKQLALISDKHKIEKVADFGLQDLTDEELTLIFTAFQPFADDTIIDISNKVQTGIHADHTTAFYQQTDSQILYFDPSLRYKIPAFQNYHEFLMQTKRSRGKIEGLGYYASHPEHLTAEHREILRTKTLSLIEQLIINNPKRIENIKYILFYAAADFPVMFKMLLTHPELKKHITELTIQQLIEYATRNKFFDGLYVLYQCGIEGNALSIATLELLLQTAIQNEDQEMFIKVKNSLEKQLILNNQIPTQTQKSLMLFKYPQKSITPIEEIDNSAIFEEKRENKNKLKK